MPPSSPLKSPTSTRAVPQGLPKSLTSFLRQRKRTFISRAEQQPGSSSTPPKAKEQPNDEHAGNRPRRRTLFESSDLEQQRTATLAPTTPCLRASSLSSVGAGATGAAGASPRASDDDEEFGDWLEHSMLQQNPVDAASPIKKQLIMSKVGDLRARLYAAEAQLKHVQAERDDAQLQAEMLRGGGLTELSDEKLYHLSVSLDQSMSRVYAERKRRGFHKRLKLRNAASEECSK